MTTERLQKVMAHAGIASRRACEQMIAQGRVQVNGRVVTEMGAKVDPKQDQIKVDGEPLRVKPAYVYLMLYKPPGYLSVFNDRRGRPGLDALVQSAQRLYPVGRLDLQSEGLVLLTNNGEIALRLTHPRYQHAKTYLALVDPRPGSDVLAKLRRGVQLEEGVTAFSRWQLLEEAPGVHPPAEPIAAGGAWLRVTLYEGRKRQIRRMATAVGLHVRRLIRIRLGPLALDRQLAPGDSRPLTRAEVRHLRSVTEKKPSRRRRPEPPREPVRARQRRAK